MRNEKTARTGRSCLPPAANLCHAMMQRPAVTLSSRQRKPAGHRQYVFVAVYLLGLYCWWMSCGFYFGVGAGVPAPVQPEADPSLECQRMRVAYEVTPGRGWGKLPTALQARWKEVGCDEFVKETASNAPAAAAASAPIATEVATPAVPAAAARATATSTAAAAAATATATATTATATTAAAAAAASAAAAAAAGCPATRKPYHTLLTGQGTIYNGWQSRIMYYHWKKVSKRDGPCTEMTGFTLGGKSRLRPRLRPRLHVRLRLRLQGFATSSTL
jgi:hypothetical protein